MTNIKLKTYQQLRHSHNTYYYRLHECYEKMWTAKLYCLGLGPYVLMLFCTTCNNLHYNINTYRKIPILSLTLTLLTVLTLTILSCINQVRGCNVSLKMHIGLIVESDLQPCLVKFWHLLVSLVIFWVITCNQHACTARTVYNDAIHKAGHVYSQIQYI